MEGLREIDVSENNLGRHFIFVPPLLEALQDQLVILEMEDCQFQHRDLHDLLTLVHRLHRLRYLNVCHNSELLKDLLLTELPQLAKVTSLEVIKVSYPEDSDSDEAEMHLFQQQLYALLVSLCDRLQRPYMKINFTT